MRWLILALLLATPAQAETVDIKWNAGDPIKSSEPWLVTDGGGYVNGWSKNFLDGTVEERRKVAAEGVLKAEIIKPKGSKGPIPFVILLHGCSGMNPLLWKWARSYADVIVAQGYGALILDSFTTRSVAGICTDPSQLNWARRRADDAYSALDYLIDKNLAVPDKVFVLGRSNGATTSLIVMNKRISELHSNKFAGAFLLQPSCLYMRTAEFYGPLHLYLAEKDDATSPTLCLTMKAGMERTSLVETIVFKDAFHGFEDKVPPYKLYGWRMGYNAAAATGTIKAFTSVLRDYSRPSPR
jgi:dienelactone hydrolase